MIDGPSMGRARSPSGHLTTDNTVAEIKAARDTALGIELDRHLCVQFSIAVPLFGDLAIFLNRAHDSDALPETVNAVGGRAKGTESIDPRLKAISSE